MEYSGSFLKFRLQHLFDAYHVSSSGGHISMDDLSNYKTKLDEIPIITKEFLGEYDMCGPPPPSSAAITQSIISTVAGK